jgi:hypothetical protein
MTKEEFFDLLMSKGYRVTMDPEDSQSYMPVVLIKNREEMDTTVKMVKEIALVYDYHFSWGVSVEQHKDN